MMGHIFQIYPQLVLHDLIDIIPFRIIDLLQQLILIAVADRCQVRYAGTDIEHMYLFGGIQIDIFADLRPGPTRLISPTKTLMS